MEVLAVIIPELRESEDEKLRKLVIYRVRTATEMTEGLRELLLSYLEKQKESLHISETCKENADSFTQEIPMPDSTTLLKMWDDEEKMLREKGIDDLWRLAYNAFLDGFAQGMMVKQKDPDLTEEVKKWKKDFDRLRKEHYGQKSSVWESPIMTHEMIMDEQKEQKQELVPHPITYTYPSDASKDERLKMALLALLNSDSIKVAGNKFTKQDLIDWVEKQKPAEWSEEDKVMLNRIAYRLKDWDNIKAQQGYQDNYASQSPVKWIESLPERFNLQPEQEWSEEDEEMWMDIKSHMIHGSFIPFDKIEWIENRLKSLRPQPKQEWSDEDEEMLEYIIGDVNDAKQLYTTQEAKDMADKEIAWLKSLRPSWKPSEEQMDALAYAIQILDDGLSPKAAKAGEELEHLREQLKKL